MALSGKKVSPNMDLGHSGGIEEQKILYKMPLSGTIHDPFVDQVDGKLDEVKAIDRT